MGTASINLTVRNPADIIQMFHSWTRHRHSPHYKFNAGAASFSVSDHYYLQLFNAMSKTNLQTCERLISEYFLYKKLRVRDFNAAMLVRTILGLGSNRQASRLVTYCIMSLS